ncbi:MAG: FAD-binding oxidoreductase, partial [Planctomycetes bacterium]|nr:FAD-binding oxidoreductase [Planctomycetota bacterium]
APSAIEDVDSWDTEVDYGLFEQRIRPLLAHRVPAFGACKCINAWAGQYAFNVFDQNAVIGRHPDIHNFIFANGFSGHGLQQSPAVGRAVSELISYGEYRSLDLSRLGFERIAANDPIREVIVV